MPRSKLQQKEASQCHACSGQEISFKGNWVAFNF